MVDPRELRLKLGLSQSKFAKRYGLSVRTVQGWESGKARDGAAELLLLLIEREPETIARILAERPPHHSTPVRKPSHLRCRPP